ncbi:hypothetical protein I317_04862 [Kwoniella heveanensis CBS 569]|nr:hypothetical protein I317_04862 [Kwoniella heveanensis CBS 569]
MPPRRSARVSAQEQDHAPETSNEDSSAAQNGPLAPPATSKKPRGRHRKAAAAAAAHPDVGNGIGDGTSVQQQAVSASIEEAPKTAKKRGRPSKAQPQATQPATAADPSTSKPNPAEKPTDYAESGPSKAKKAKKDDKPPKKEVEEKPKATKGKGRVKKVDPNMDRYARVQGSGCPENFFKKFKKAISQRMFMIAREKGGTGQNQYEDFKILGSTGNVYTTRICSKPKCDCPDYIFNGRTICKHTIFVLIRVLKDPDESSVWYRSTLTASEIEQIFAKAPPTPNEAIHADARKAYMRATGASVEEEAVAEEVKAEAEAAGVNLNRLEVLGDDCPVCYEEITEDNVKEDKLVYDDTPTGCGKGLHKECFDMWANTATSKHQPVTCVWCRAPWPIPGGANVSPSKGHGKVRISGQNYHSMGYMNMAEAAGMSQPRGVQCVDYCTTGNVD